MLCSVHTRPSQMPSCMHTRARHCGVMHQLRCSCASQSATSLASDPADVVAARSDLTAAAFGDNLRTCASQAACRRRVTCAQAAHRAPSSVRVPLPNPCARAGGARQQMERCGAIYTRADGAAVCAAMAPQGARASRVRQSSLTDTTLSVNAQDTLCATMQVNPDIRKEKWSAEEDRLLASLVAEHGNRWADIAKQCALRTPNCWLCALNVLQASASRRAAARRSGARAASLARARTVDAADCDGQRSKPSCGRP